MMMFDIQRQMPIHLPKNFEMDGEITIEKFDVRLDEIFYGNQQLTS